MADYQHSRKYQPMNNQSIFKKTEDAVQYAFWLIWDVNPKPKYRFVNSIDELFNPKETK